MGDERQMRWTLRAATAADATAISELVTAAGLAAWAAFLGAERIEGANRRRG